MEEYSEEITIPVYEEHHDKLEKRNGDVHYKTKNKVFKYSEIIAIASKGSSIDNKYNYSRGGALIYVEGREEPYLTKDNYSVAKVWSEINKNPLACCSGLFEFGSSNVYAKKERVKRDGKKIIWDCREQLILTNEAVRYIKWIKYILTKGPKKSCPRETKKRCRKKSRKL